MTYKDRALFAIHEAFLLLEQGKVLAAKRRLEGEIVFQEEQKTFGEPGVNAGLAKLRQAYKRLLKWV